MGNCCDCVGRREKEAYNVPAVSPPGLIHGVQSYRTAEACTRQYHSDQLDEVTTQASPESPDSTASSASSQRTPQPSGCSGPVEDGTEPDAPQVSGCTESEFFGEASFGAYYVAHFCWHLYPSLAVPFHDADREEAAVEIIEKNLAKVQNSQSGDEAMSKDSAGAESLQENVQLQDASTVPAVEPSLDDSKPAEAPVIPAATTGARKLLKLKNAKLTKGGKSAEEKAGREAASEVAQAHALRLSRGEVFGAVEFQECVISQKNLSFLPHPGKILQIRQDGFQCHCTNVFEEPFAEWNLEIEDKDDGFERELSDGSEHQERRDWGSKKCSRAVLRLSTRRSNFEYFSDHMSVEPYL